MSERTAREGALARLGIRDRPEALTDAEWRALLNAAYFIRVSGDHWVWTGSVVGKNTPVVFIQSSPSMTNPSRLLAKVLEVPWARRVCPRVGCINPRHRHDDPRRSDQRLSPSDVRTLRKLYREGGGHVTFGSSLGVDSKTATNAARGLTYKWVQDEEEPNE